MNELDTVYFLFVLVELQVFFLAWQVDKLVTLKLKEKNK